MAKEKSMGAVFLNGIINENPTFRLVLGTCPTLASTTSATDGLGMGLAATFVLLGSNVVISLLRNFIPEKVRIPSFVVVICTFVTIVQMLIKAFVPALDQSLGVFIPLIVVNCIILARAEAFASKNSVARSAMDGIGMGLGFTMAIMIMGVFRELIASGTVFGLTVMSAGYQPMLLIGMASGGFITFGLYLALFNLIMNTVEVRRLRKEGAKV